MYRVAFAVVLTPLLWGSSSIDPSINVCLDDRIRIGSRAKQAFLEELRLLSASTIHVSDQRCSASKRIRISIRSHAPIRYETALGLALTKGDRVLPEIELYVMNILRTFDRQVGSERFGRALAKVAFHELQHYLRQERPHDGEGLFVPALSGTRLLAVAETAP